MYDSYAKQRLTSLHPNVMVQRSPSHFQTGTFYWAHVSHYIFDMCFTDDDLVAREIMCDRPGNCFHGRS